MPEMALPPHLSQMSSWLGSRGVLLMPLFLSLWMAWGDIRTQRIPNYLTLGTALTGLSYQALFGGLAGLTDGLLGMGLALLLLLLPYLWGGMGAGDVKALAGLGAWLDPLLTFCLFFYMSLAGMVLAFIILWRRGLLRQELRQTRFFLLNLILFRLHKLSPPTPSYPEEGRGIPYAAAMAAGMVLLMLGGQR